MTHGPINIRYIYMYAVTLYVVTLYAVTLYDILDVKNA